MPLNLVKFSLLKMCKGISCHSDDFTTWRLVTRDWCCIALDVLRWAFTRQSSQVIPISCIYLDMWIHIVKCECTLKLQHIVNSFNPYHPRKTGYSTKCAPLISSNNESALRRSLTAGRDPCRISSHFHCWPYFFDALGPSPGTTFTLHRPVSTRSLAKPLVWGMLRDFPSAM